MSGVVEEEEVEEKTAGSTPQDMDHHEQRHDETWTVTLTPTSMTDSSLEENTMEENDNTEKPKSTHEIDNGKVEYTTKTGQYSPENPQTTEEVVKEEKEEEIFMSTDSLLSTDTCTNGLPIGEYTPGDKRDVTHIANKEQIEASPIEKLSMIEDYTDDSGVATSPVTSTPGSTPGSNKRGTIIDSELQNSEESIIGSSMIEEEKANRVYKVSGKIKKHPISSKEVDETETPGEEDSDWETVMTDTDTGSENEEGEEPVSCIARRTRSHARGLRKKNLTLLLGELKDNTVEGSFEITGVKANDSLTLAKQINNNKEEEKEEKDWDKREEWCKRMVNLNKSMEKARKVIGTKSRVETLEAYRKRGEEVIQKRQIPEEGNEEVTEKTGRRVTFNEHQERYSTALEEVTNTLEILLRLKTETAPRKHVENIVKIIVSICIDTNIQLQNAQNTIKIMSEVIEEMTLKVNEEELKQEIEELKKDKEAQQRTINRLDLFNKHLAEFEKQSESERINDSGLVEQMLKLKVDRDELRREIEKLTEERESKDSDYDEVNKKQEYYREQMIYMEKKVNEVMDMRNEEKRSMEERLNTKIKDIQALRERAKHLNEECSVYREQIKETSVLRIELNNMKNYHKLEKERIAKERVAERVAEMAKTQELSKQLDTLQTKYDNTRQEYEAAMRERDREVIELTNDIGERWRDLTNTKGELINNLKELGNTRKLISDLIRDNTEKNNMINELVKEAEANKDPNVANRKPGPHREGEGMREETPDMFVDSMISEGHTTTGAIVGDSDMDADIESFNDNDMTPRKRKRYEHTSETSDSSVESYNTISSVESHNTVVERGGATGISRPSNTESDSTPMSEDEKYRAKQMEEQKEYYEEKIKKLKKNNRPKKRRNRRKRETNFRD